MIILEYTEDFEEPREWHMLITAHTYEYALKELMGYVNDNDAIAGIIRIVHND